jgi:hypothetical protein
MSNDHRRSSFMGALLRAMAGMVLAVLCLGSGIAAQQLWQMGPVQWTAGEEGTAVQFHNITASALLSGSRGAVGSSGNHEIVVLGSDGRLHWRRGRQGRGPGEFQSIDGVTTYRGDSVAVVDGRLRRVSVFSSAGVLGRVFDLPRLPAGSSVTGLHQFTDGTLVLGTLRGRMPGDPVGAIRSQGALIQLSPNGEYMRVVAELLGDEWFSTRDQRMLGLMPFGMVTRYVILGNRILIADGTMPGVREVTIPADVERIVRIPNMPQRRITERDVREFTRKTLEETAPEARPIIADALREVEFPQYLPLTMNLAAGTNGAVWVQEFCAPATDTTTWHVLSPSAAVMATVQVPCRQRVLAATEDAVFLLVTDQFGTERIARTALRQ